VLLKVVAGLALYIGWL